MNGGIAGSTGPCSLATAEPNCGQPPPGVGLAGSCPLKTWMASWSAWLPTSERTMASLSIIPASRGKASQISMPGTLVGDRPPGPGDFRGRIAA